MCHVDCFGDKEAKHIYGGKINVTQYIYIYMYNDMLRLVRSTLSHLVLFSMPHDEHVQVSLHLVYKYNGCTFFD
jgi:hypothetical protein